jgi:hypothetical protein
MDGLARGPSGEHPPIRASAKESASAIASAVALRCAIALHCAIVTRDAVAFADAFVLHPAQFGIRFIEMEITPCRSKVSRSLGDPSLPMLGFR